MNLVINSTIPTTAYKKVSRGQGFLLGFERVQLAIIRKEKEECRDEN